MQKPQFLVNLTTGEHYFDNIVTPHNFVLELFKLAKSQNKKIHYNDVGFHWQIVDGEPLDLTNNKIFKETQTRVKNMLLKVKHMLSLEFPKVSGRITKLVENKKFPYDSEVKQKYQHINSEIGRVILSIQTLQRLSKKITKIDDAIRGLKKNNFDNLYQCLQLIHKYRHSFTKMNMSFDVFINIFYSVKTHINENK